jgi:hypothetical protein
MQKEQALQRNAEVAGGTLKCRSSRLYTVMQKKEALHCDAEAAGGTH